MPSTEKSSPDLSEMNALLSRFGVPMDSEPLSMTQRGIVKTMPDEAAVLRISRVAESRPRRGSNEFTRYFFKHQETVHSLVPIASPPLVVNKRFVVEKYGEIVYEKDKHMDLHTFCGLQSDETRICQYLHDVILTVADLHDHHWAHMDLSLENVVLSKTKGYLIDFESCTQFGKKSHGYVQRACVGGPMKFGFVPPEHFGSAASEFVHLPSYDIWAFGVMLFGALFGTYLVGTVDLKTRQMKIDMGQLEFLCEKGLAKYIEKYHPRAWKKLTVKPRPKKEAAAVAAGSLNFETRRLAFDLLNRIFVPPQRRRNANDNAVYFSVRNRFNARQVIAHPFWRKIMSE